jgi:hypothetical protein
MDHGVHCTAGDEGWDLATSEVWGWRPHGVPEDFGDKAAFSAAGNLGDRGDLKSHILVSVRQGG